MMDYAEALEQLADRPEIELYRRLCAEDNANARQRDSYRSLVIRMVAMPDSFPPMSEQLASAARAAISTAADFLAGRDLFVSEAEYRRRLSICLACEHYDPAQIRCRVCGCMGVIKFRLASQACPIAKWAASQ
jgi:hypothetical protein